MSVLPPVPGSGSDSYGRPFGYQSQAYTPQIIPKTPFWPFLVGGLAGMVGAIAVSFVTNWIGSLLPTDASNNSSGSAIMFGVGLVLVIPVMIALMHGVLRVLLPRRGIVEPVPKPVARYALASVIAVVAGGMLLVVAFVTSVFGFIALSSAGDGAFDRAFLVLGFGVIVLVVGTAMAFTVTVWLVFRSEVRGAWMQRPVPLSPGFAAAPMPGYGAPSSYSPTYSQPTYPQDAVDRDIQDRR